MNENNNFTTTEVFSYNTILEYLYQQLDNFQSLKSFVITKDIRPSVVFLPQTIKQISAELSSRTDLLLDCIDFLDVVKIYSLLLYSDEQYFTNKVVKLIVSNRAVNTIEFVLSRESLDDFIFNSEEEAVEFIENNKSLLSIYLCSLVVLIFFEK